MSRSRFALLLCIAVVLPRGLSAQAPSGYEAHMLRGDSLTDVLQPTEALEEYRAAYLAQQTYEARWKFALAQIDVARLLDDNQRDLRDSLYNVAFLYARSATRADSTDAEGYFTLALALGRLSMTKGGKDRVRYAGEIYDAAGMAVEIDPEHDGAYHILGMWHAEIQRLSGIERFFARTFLSGGFMARASWDSATVHMERAVALKPEHLQHRFDLAGVYVDLERYADARQQLEEVLRLQPDQDVLDRQTQADAATLLEEIRER